MATRRGKRTRSEMSDDQVGVEAEMEKWKKVAQMIGVTLDDVCNMAEAERSALVLLVPTENNGKDNVDPAEDLVDVEDLLGSSDGEDNFYGKPSENSTVSHGTHVTETPLKKVKVMIERCDVDMKGGFLGGNICSSSSSSPVSTNLNDEYKSPTFKKRSKPTSLTPRGSGGKDVNWLTSNEIGGLKTLEDIVKSNETLSFNAVLQKVTSWNSNKLNTKIVGTLQPIASSNDYFKIMEKNPQKYKLDKKCSSLVSLEEASSSSLRVICHGLEGIKFVKSQGVCTGQEDPGLVRIGPDNSVKNGFAAVKRKGMGRGLVEKTSEKNGNKRFTRTTRNSSNATSSDIYDDIFDYGEHASSDDFEIDNNDYMAKKKVDKKQSIKRGGTIISDSDDDFKDDVKEVNKGERAKITKMETRQNPLGVGKNRVKISQGKGKGSPAGKSDGNQPSMLDFVDSTRFGKLNANEKPVSYDPLSHLVKLGGDRGNEPTSSSSSHGPLPQSANFGAGGSDALTPTKRMSSSTKSSLERQDRRTYENKNKGQTGICPLCLKVQWKNQLAMHAAECSGDTAEAGSDELCSWCLKLIPAGNFKLHTLRCSGD